LHRVEGVSTTESADGIFLVDPAGGRLYQLNAAGKAIWMSLEAPIAVDELCVRLTKEFSGDADTIHRDTMTLLQQLKTKMLVRVIGEE